MAFVCFCLFHRILKQFGVAVCNLRTPLPFRTYRPRLICLGGDNLLYHQG